MTVYIVREYDRTIIDIFLDKDKAIKCAAEHGWCTTVKQWEVTE